MKCHLLDLHCLLKYQLGGIQYKRVKPRSHGPRIKSLLRIDIVCCSVSTFYTHNEVWRLYLKTSCATKMIMTFILLIDVKSRITMNNQCELNAIFMFSIFFFNILVFS